MLSPGDTVFLDGEESKGLQGKRWTVRAVARPEDLTHLPETQAPAYYQYQGWPDPNEWVPSTRITAHWVQS